MKNIKNMKNIIKKYLIYLAVTVGLSAIFGITSRLSAGASEWYAVTVYPLIVGTVGRFFGVFPFSVAEILLIWLMIAGLAGTVLFIIAMKNSKGKRKYILVKTVLPLLCVLSTILLIFITNCGINYSRYTLFYDKDYSYGYTIEDEWNVYLLLLEEFHALELQIVTDESGVFKLTGELSEIAPAAMRNLSRQEPRLDVYYSRPKPVLFSELMADAFIGGIFSPFTLEANYNNVALDSDKAMFALHELAHTAGFMREDEANFIAFWAARESGDPELVYLAYLYVLGEMRRLNMMFEKHQEFYELLPTQIRADLFAQSTFWWSRRSESAFVEVVSEVTSTINDAYLRIQGQEDGVASYGRMIDLVMAMYCSDN